MGSPAAVARCQPGVPHSSGLLLSGTGYCLRRCPVLFEVNMYDWNDVESTNIRRIGWSPEGPVLAVQFKSKKEGQPDAVYTYDGFPQEKFREFLASPSKGTWFSANVRGRYQTRKIE